jgi:hypothetical protein
MRNGYMEPPNEEVNNVKVTVERRAHTLGKLKTFLKPEK